MLLLGLTVGALALVLAAAWRRRARPAAAVARALAALGPRWRARVPAVAEAQALSFGDPGRVSVYLACEREADRPALAAQLPELADELRAELARHRAGPGVGAGLTLRAASREAVAREGGWYAYFHNVP